MCRTDEFSRKINLVEGWKYRLSIHCGVVMGEAMDIQKSTRHQRIIGDFGESFLLNWLSRSGFEVCLVDHTGLDVIAYQPSTKKRLGISVKSRTRNLGQENTSVHLLSYQKKDRQKLLDACRAFACEAYIAVYIETTNSADLYLTSLAHYDDKYRKVEDCSNDSWKMGKKHTDEYEKDTFVKHVRMSFSATHWECPW